MANGIYRSSSRGCRLRLMAILRRLLNPLSTRLTEWWCHLGTRRTRGVIVVVPAEEVEDVRGR